MSNGNYASHPNNFQILQSIQNAQNAQNAINAQHSQHLQNVAGAVKQLHDLRHSPASPNVQRRSLAQNHHSASSNNHPHPPQSNVIIIFLCFPSSFFPKLYVCIIQILILVLLEFHLNWLEFIDFNQIWKLPIFWDISDISDVGEIE